MPRGRHPRAYVRANAEAAKKAILAAQKKPRQFTGPLHVLKGEALIAGFHDVITDDNDDYLALVDPGDTNVSELFAAAPDMLAVIREAYELMPLGTTKRAEWVSRAIAAMNKAEGRTE